MGWGAPAERGRGDVGGGLPLGPALPVLTPEDRDASFRAGCPDGFLMASEQEGKQAAVWLHRAEFCPPREVCPCPNPRIQQDEDDFIQKQGLCSRAG